MEIPCLLEFSGSCQDSHRVEKLISDSMGLQSAQKGPPLVFHNKEAEQSNRKRTLDEQTSDDKQEDHQLVKPEGKKIKQPVLLSSDDNDDIIMEIKLSDKHISYAQALLKAQFPIVNGLECTLLQSKPSSSDATIQNKAQIFHDWGDHWIAVTNMSIVAAVGEVVVFDSVYYTIDKHTERDIIGKFSKGSETPPKLRIAKFTKQNGSTDCRLFAIAVVTALVFGQEPSTLKFIQEKMRPHLFACFHEKKMKPFPTA